MIEHIPVAQHEKEYQNKYINTRNLKKMKKIALKLRPFMIWPRLKLSILSQMKSINQSINTKNCCTGNCRFYPKWNQNLLTTLLTFKNRKNHLHLYRINKKIINDELGTHKLLSQCWPIWFCCLFWKLQDIDSSKHRENQLKIGKFKGCRFYPQCLFYPHFPYAAVIRARSAINYVLI